MRIAMFMDGFPVITETFIVNQITGLLDRGHAVDIFARHPHSPAHVHPDIGRYALLDRAFYLETTEGKAKRVLGAAGLAMSPAWLRNGALGALATILRQSRRFPAFNKKGMLQIARREAEHGPYDVVHCQYGTLGIRLITLRQAGLIHGKLITSFRGHDLTQTDKVQRGYYAPLFREGEMFLPVSEALAGRLAALGCPPEKILVHHSGIDLTQFPFKPRCPTPNAPTRVVTVARLVEMKGVEYGIEAVARLITRGVPVEYHIIGAGRLQAQLEAKIHALGLTQQVRLRGALPHDQVVKVMAASHLMLHPSVTASNGEAEGIPNAVKEAMALGLPIVATRHAGVPELVEDGVSGLLVPERDADALAACVAALCADPGRWPAMGRAGRARIEVQYDRNRLNDELVRLYSR